MDDIKFYKPSELEKNLKVTIHRSGKMGFSSDAAIKLKLPAAKSAQIGFRDGEEDVLYLVVYTDNAPDSFKVSKAGQYYYINTKVLFDNLKMDVSKGDIVYEITEVEHRGEILKNMYRLKRRPSDLKEKAHKGLNDSTNSLNK
jgi:hypothetical protein